MTSVEWISVEERLPEYEREVLGASLDYPSSFSGGSVLGSGVLVKVIGNGETIFLFDGKRLREVTHWAELPDPPKAPAAVLLDHDDTPNPAG